MQSPTSVVVLAPHSLDALPRRSWAGFAVLIALMHLVAAKYALDAGPLRSPASVPPATIDLILPSSAQSPHPEPPTREPVRPPPRVAPAPGPPPPAVRLPTPVAVESPVASAPSSFTLPPPDSRPVSASAPPLPAPPTPPASTAGSGAPSGAAPAAPASAPASAPAPANLSIGAVEYLAPPVLQYPPASRRLQEEGRVNVRVLVDVDGRPRDTRMLRSSGYPRLDAAALATVLATRFKPYTENGVPRAFWVVIPLQFELEN